MRYVKILVLAFCVLAVLPAVAWAASYGVCHDGNGKIQGIAKNPSNYQFFINNPNCEYYAHPRHTMSTINRVSNVIETTKFKHIKWDIEPAEMSATEKTAEDTRIDNLRKNAERAAIDNLDFPGAIAVEGLIDLINKKLSAAQRMTIDEWKAETKQNRGLE